MCSFYLILLGLGFCKVLLLHLIVMFLGDMKSKLNSNGQDILQIMKEDDQQELMHATSKSPHITVSSCMLFF